MQIDEIINEFFQPELNNETFSIMQNIGRWIKLKETKYGYTLLPYKIVNVQKDFAGKSVYRIKHQLDTFFGRCLNENEIECFLTIEEAETLWNNNISKTPYSFEWFNDNF